MRKKIVDPLEHVFKDFFEELPVEKVNYEEMNNYKNQ